MKAAQIREYGDASVVEIAETDRPTAGEGRVLIEVHASSLNPVDSAIRSGYMHQMMPVQFPVVLGGDVAGVVTEVGPGVEGLKVGDRVYGQANAAFGDSGAFAEYAATAVDHVALAPKNLDFNEAASLPLVGVSAVQALTEHIKLGAGQKVLITGGSGGIGTVAIQVAKALGAYVATTATGEGVKLVKGLGADEVFDYKSQDAASILKEYDAVFDTVGGQGFDKTLKVLKKGGIAVSMIAPPNAELASEQGVTAMTQMTMITAERLETLRDLVEAGSVKTQVSKVYALDEIRDAFVTREAGAVNGKVVLEIKK